jgi:hypothetical protein
MSEVQEPCAEGRCGPIITAAHNPGEFDSSVLGPTPNGHHYGYCQRCRQAWRWIPERMGWEKWDR